MTVTAQGAEGQLGSSLPPDQLLAMYRLMVLARLLDERGNILNRQGRLHFIVPTQGHEAAQIGVAAAMRKRLDYLLCYYRSAPMVLAMGMSPRDVFLNLFGRSEDPSGGGTNVPGQYGCPELRIISTSNVIATHLLHAVGVAHAARYRNEPAVAVTTFGDGSTSAGAFHEALNWAGVHKLPVVFVCENNGYAISVPQRLQMPIHDVAARAQGYGMPGLVVDGTDVLAVYEAARTAIERARDGGGPALIECKVERLLAHSSADDDARYRPRDEVATAREQRDPVKLFQSQVLRSGLLTPEADQQLWAEIGAEVTEAAESAEASAAAPAEESLRHVYAGS
jgi:2-oxoisovalerate dehydrogenase E1 component subunit alpha